MFESRKGWLGLMSFILPSAGDQQHCQKYYLVVLSSIRDFNAPVATSNTECDKPLPKHRSRKLYLP